MASLAVGMASALQMVIANVTMDIEVTAAICLVQA